MTVIEKIENEIRQANAAQSFFKGYAFKHSQGFEAGLKRALMILTEQNTLTAIERHIQEVD